MANPKIYNVNWKILALTLLPPKLRNNVWLRFFVTIFSPFIQLHNTFLNYRKSTLYWMGINSQVCFLEMMLNDRYDNAQRRIYIAKPQIFPAQYIYLRAESKPLFIYKKSENLPVYLYTKAETLIGGINFIVVIPVSLIANLVEMAALIDKYKLPDKEYLIKRL